MSTLRTRVGVTSPMLLAGIALLLVYYAPVWRAIYSVGIPTGLATTMTQVIPLAFLCTFLVLARGLIQWRDAAFFVVLSLGSGFGGAVGSIVGNAGGFAWLVTGALGGGVLASFGVVRLSARIGWIPDSALVRTSFAAVAGFLAASAVAVSTLSSPIGPLVSTTLVGAAGLWAVWHHRERCTT